MQLIDEEDDLAVGLVNFFQDGFEAFFELAAELRAGEHRTEIERDDALVAQDLRHVALEDTASEAFDDSCLADAGFADQYRIVLGAAAEHLDDAANLLVAADDGIELAAAGEVGQVLGVFFQRLELALGVLVGDSLRATNGLKSFQDGSVVRAQRG